MNKILMPLILGILILMGPGLAQAATVALSIVNSNGVSVTSGGAIQPGSTVTLTATVSGVASSSYISEVEFYETQGTIVTLLGTSASPTPPGSFIYTYMWSVPSTNNASYTLSAQVDYNNGVSILASNTNGLIDIVGGSGTPYQSGNVGIGTIVPGDNQLCAAPINPSPVCGATQVSTATQFCSIPATYGWPYNGATQGQPDGTCQWTGLVGSAGIPASNTPGAASTVDQLDNVEHTLSDFDILAKSILSRDVGKLDTSLNSWYSSVGNFIAPACTEPECNDPTSATTCTDIICHRGNSGKPQAGRLLSLYEPGSQGTGFPGYPGLAGNYASLDYSGTTVDLLQGWYTSITNWLNNTYDTLIPSSIISGNTSLYPWCLPPVTTGSAVEDTYIQNNSGSAHWGDLANVIACLNYNAQNATQAFVQCQQALVSTGTCLGTTPPTVCPGRSLVTGQAVTGVNGSGVPPSYTSPGACTTNACVYSPGTCPTSGQCYNGSSCIAGTYTYADWVRDSIVLSQDEAPKFALRAQFLSDIYTRARSMQSIFNQGEVGLHSFLKTCNQCAIATACPTNGQCSDGTSCGPPSCPNGGMCTNGLCVINCPATLVCPNGSPCASGSQCPGPVIPCLAAGQCSIVGACPASGICAGTGTGTGIPQVSCNEANCADGGPAAQLMYGRINGAKASGWPNAVIYGWVDNPSANGLPGKAHMVKVTAYSAQRNGASNPLSVNDSAYFQNSLPNITTWDTFFLQKYALQNRDGYVYVDVKRWDQDQAQNSPLNFPNGHALWQFIYHKPTVNTITATGLPGVCLGLSVGSGANNAGWGLMPLTVQGLNYVPAYPTGNNKSQIALQDVTALGNAFMLNDEGNGGVDPTLGTTPQTTPSCFGGNGSTYCQCLSQANALLLTGTESKACVEYIASSPASNPNSVRTGSSGNNDQDYSLKFVNCNTISPTPTDDLVGSS